jgi:hypothetical protein
LSSPSEAARVAVSPEVKGDLLIVFGYVVIGEDMGIAVAVKEDTAGSYSASRRNAASGL